MTGILSRRLLHISMIGASVPALMATSAQAQVQAQAKPFSISPQPLSSALLEFSRQADVHVVVPPELTAGKRSQGLRATLPVQKAIGSLLQGSNLRAVPSGRGYRIERLSGGSRAVSDASGDADTSGQETTTRLAASGEEQTAAELTNASSASQEVVVVGTRLGRATGAQSVRVIDKADIESTAAVSGDELLRSIPQMGEVLFNPGRNPTSSNAARGDITSINLRDLGVGNTLVLINGRRQVAHPTTAANSSGVPVVTYNSNAIPVAGIARLEVLLEGAGALYGSDAVAGVVNTILQSDFEGVQGEVQYGLAESTNLTEFHANALLGQNLGERGNITLFGSYDRRTALLSGDQDYTATLDKRPLFEGTPFYFEFLDQRSPTSPFGSFRTINSSVVTRNGVALTSGAGAFHIQPSTLDGCRAALANGLCIDDGAAVYGGAENSLRYDAPRANNITVQPAVKRVNLFATANYDLTPDIELFGEAGYYHSQSSGVQAPPNLLVAFNVPATNYYNPFGPVTFANGQANPNRLSGINVPVGGVALSMTNYLFSDFGPNIVDVEGSQYRLLGGLRFNALGFNFETAALYSESRSQDTVTGISATLLQKQLALSTPDAYNPFNGGNLLQPSLADTTPSNQAAIDAITVKAVRDSTATLAMADLHARNNALFELPGGPVGLALGLEIRRETMTDDRASAVDGSQPFTDIVTGVVSPSDLIFVSSSLDVRGVRTVKSAFGELAIPLVSPEMGIPFIHRAELQIAGRYEHYSDVGSVAKPKVAGFIDIIPGLRFRGSYAQGFRAPNLEQTNAQKTIRNFAQADWVFCEADLRAGRIATYGNCTRTVLINTERAGNPDLKPETSTSWTVGTVLQPRFIPARFGSLTLTADYYDIRQKDIVGLTGVPTSVALDLLRKLDGSNNPNVIRAAPTADDIAAFAGTGLTPVGQIQTILDRYVNLLPLHVAGIDFGLNWSLRDTSIGSFRVNANATYLKTYFQDANPAVLELLEAQAAGELNEFISLQEGGSLIKLGGSKPRWKLAGSLTWNIDQFQLGAFVQYTSSVFDGFTDADGNIFVIDDQITGNLYGQWEVGKSDSHSMRFRIGVRNITNEKPPLASPGFAFGLYNPYPRYWYASVGVSY